MEKPARRSSAALLTRPALSGSITCDVIVCCYTEARWDLLAAAIRSLAEQDVAPDRVVIVVDHNEALLRRVRAEWPWHTVVGNHYAQGLSGARNTGVEHTSADAIGFLDDDAIATPSWLGTIVAWFEDPHVVGVSARVDSQFDGQRPGWFPPEFDWVIGCSYIGLPTRPAVVRNPIGAAMAFRRTSFIDHGGFRCDGLGRISGGTGGCEETEFAIRATRSAATSVPNNVPKNVPKNVVVYDPSAAASQFVPRDRQTLSYFVRRCYGEGLATAAVTAFTGPTAGTSAERSYATKTLPAAVWRDGRDALRLRSLSRAGRVGAVALGLGTTTAGYVVGRLRWKRAQRGGISLDDAPAIRPVVTPAQTA